MAWVFDAIVYFTNWTFVIIQGILERDWLGETSKTGPIYIPIIFVITVLMSMLLFGAQVFRYRRKKKKDKRRIKWWEICFFVFIEFWKLDATHKTLILSGLVLAIVIVITNRYPFYSLEFEFLMLALNYTTVLCMKGIFHLWGMSDVPLFWWQLILWPFLWFFREIWFTIDTVEIFYPPVPNEQEKILDEFEGLDDDNEEEEEEEEEELIMVQQKPKKKKKTKNFFLYVIDHFKKKS